MQKASQGRMVLLIGGVARSNGTDTAPAIVTRAWSDTMVNLIVYPDCAQPAVAPSITLFEDEQAARDWIAADEYRSTAAYWPPRV